jgi:hypothetical protein
MSTIRISQRPIGDKLTHLVTLNENQLKKTESVVKHKAGDNLAPISV